MKKFNNRIFLKTNGEIREFLWLEQGTDGSLYLGQAGKVFNYGYKGSYHADKNNEYGAFVDPSTGDSLTDDELRGKLSFHKSGIICLSTRASDKRDRLKMSAFSDFEGVLPLIGVIPMLPTKYPISEKQVKENDVVIECGLNQGRRIGIVIFVAFDDSEPSLLKMLQENGFYFDIKYVSILDKRLGVMVYFNNRFLDWPSEQVEVMAHPDEKGEVHWPIIVP